jgi:hypothetical protein
MGLGFGKSPGGRDKKGRAVLGMEVFSGWRCEEENEESQTGEDLIAEQGPNSWG